ncbi:MAG TPA: hypothetical protein DEB40_11610 [Elusimicrobia bacterium]|nr:hypothetical protein [Elusimicrobiota bacterium]HBT62379.1 hypothetical protein [Elusimicrobiota bacterium]
MTAPRSIEQLIEEQVRRWELSRRNRIEPCRHEPVITISRLPGCCGRALAEELARRLKFDLFDKEILQRVAQNAHLSESIVKTVDEKAVSAAEEWVRSLFMERYICGEYFHHLSRVFMAISAHGRAIILGRGAGCIIPPQCCLRVLLVAPLEERIRTVACRDGLSRDEAKRRVVLVESDRRAFIRRHFHMDMLDPIHYDLVLNTAGLGREPVLAAIQAAWRAKPQVEAAAK